MTRTNPTDLERRLGLGVADDQELARTVGEAMGGANYTTRSRIDYPNSDHPALSLHFGKQRALVSIEAGDALTAELAAQIERSVTTKLLAPAKPSVFRTALFAPWPTVGYWRYADKFVILPAPEQAPRPVTILGDHPLVLEVMHEGAVDQGLRPLRGWKESRRIGLLLSLFIPGLKLPSNSSRHLWVTPIDREAPAEVRSVFAQEHYRIPGFSAMGDDLSDQGELPAISLSRTFSLTVGVGQVLEIQRHTEALLDTFFALPEAKQRRLLRAAYWLHHAQAEWSVSRSAYYQALVQAVEVLIDTPPNQAKCTECDRTLGVGPTALFRKFLDEYTPPAGEDDEAARKVLYKTRSDITHGLRLLYDDEEDDFGWNNPEPIYDAMLVQRAHWVCRTAVIGWLGAHSE